MPVPLIPSPHPPSPLAWTMDKGPAPLIQELLGTPQVVGTELQYLGEPPSSRQEGKTRV